MNWVGKTIFSLIGILIVSFSQGQDLEVTQILAQREASNKALRNYDHDLNATFSTDDLFITSGLGTLISGKEAQAAYINSLPGPKMYWIRTPDEVIVNSKILLAWETGTWKGYVEGSDEAVVGGKYSAQWPKKSGTWLIQSQLFVTLEN